MATRGTQGARPQLGDIDGYPEQNITKLLKTITVVTYDGLLRFKATGLTSRASTLPLPSTTNAERWNWVTFGLRYVYDGTATRIVIAGNSGNQWSYRTKPISATTFQLEVGGDNVVSYTVRGTSSTTFTQDTDLICLAQYDTDTDAYKLWINGDPETDAPEIEFTYSAADMGPLFNMGNGGVAGLHELATGEDLYWWNIAGRESDLESGRPDTSPTYVGRIPSGNTAEDDATGVGPDNGTDKWKNWDELGVGPPDEDTSYNLLDDTGQQQVSEMNLGTAALTGDMTRLSVSGYLRHRAADVDKSANSWMRFKDDGGTAKEFALPNLVITDYITVGRHVGDPPAGAWEDYVNGSDVFNGTGATKKLQMGQRSDSNNDINIRDTMIVMEVCALGNNPPGPDEGHQDYPNVSIPSNPRRNVVASGMTVGGEVE